VFYLCFSVTSRSGTCYFCVVESSSKHTDLLPSLHLHFVACFVLTSFSNVVVGGGGFFFLI
jgi:hypothetical protein